MAINLKKVRTLPGASRRIKACNSYGVGLHSRHTMPSLFNANSSVTGHLENTNAVDALGGP